MGKKFKIGDLVELKSGSPKMTVDKVVLVGEPNRVICKWFEGNILKQEKFHEDVLCIVHKGSSIDQNS